MLYSENNYHSHTKLSHRINTGRVRDLFNYHNINNMERLILQSDWDEVLKYARVRFWKQHEKYYVFFHFLRKLISLWLMYLMSSSIYFVFPKQFFISAILWSVTEFQICFITLSCLCDLKSTDKAADMDPKQSFISCSINLQSQRTV